jgi:hydroxyacylglutathione hydrolase
MQNYLLLLVFFLTVVITQVHAQESEIIIIKDQFFFNSFLYKIPNTNKFVLVDTTRHNRENIILEELKKRKIDPKDIAFVFITHYHSDHTDGNFQLQKTIKAPFSCPFLECKYLTQGVKVPLPHSLYPFVNTVVKWISTFKEFELVQYEAKVQLRGGEILSEFGSLKVLHTPGHTNGSLSLVSTNGDCFVGDVLFGSFFGENIPTFHPLLVYEDFPKLYPSIKLLLDENCKVFYPDHGMKMDRSSVVKFLERNEKFLSGK